MWKKTSLNEIKRDMLQILDRIAHDILNSNREKEIENTLSLRCLSVTKDLKDASEYINVKNGLLSLKTFELKKHRKKIFSTKQLPINYNPEAKAPLWKKFLNDIFLGDKQLRLLLQEMTGYILSTKTDAQKFFFLYSLGSSGKSVYCKIVTALVGGKDYVSSVTLSGLQDKFARSQMQEAAVNIAAENELKHFPTETIKAIASGDIVQMEKKGQNAVSDVITAKLVFCVNNLPIPKDKTYAIYRRLIIVPFLARFVEEPKRENELPVNPNMTNDLMLELEGILAWAIRGLKRLIKNDYKFTSSEKANEFLNEFRTDVDIVFNFVEEAINKADENSTLEYKLIYKAFENWHKENNVDVTGLYRNQNFNRMFLKDIRQYLDQKNIPYDLGHSGSTNYIKGIKLKKSFIEKYL